MTSGGASNYQSTSVRSTTSEDTTVAAASCKAFVANNVGLLLVAGSELFFAFMHLAVKILNGIDPPVTTFEVCVLVPSQ